MLPGRVRHPLAVGQNCRRTSAVRRPALLDLRVPQHRVKNAVVAAFDHDEVVLAAGTARDAQGGHHRLGARIGKAHQLRGRHHLGDAPGHRVFALGAKSEHAADRHALPGSRVHFRMGVTQYVRTVGQAIVDVLVVIDIDETGAATALDVDGSVVAPIAEARGDTQGQLLHRLGEVGVGTGQVATHTAYTPARLRPSMPATSWLVQ